MDYQIEPEKVDEEINRDIDIDIDIMIHDLLWWIIFC